MKATHRDPITGDLLTDSEWRSWQIQRVIRNWSWLGLTQLLTVIAWILGAFFPVILIWWNLIASDYAVVLETIVGIAFFSQTLRDAVVSRQNRAISKRVEAMEKQNVRMEREHGEQLDALHAKIDMLLAKTQPPRDEQGRFMKRT